MKETTVFYINDFQIDLSRSMVSKNGQQTSVEPKVLKVLLLLAEREGEVVTHQEIKTHVWQDTEVVPNALQRCIAILRKVLNDNAKSPTIIATHPKIGYSLLIKPHWHSPVAKSVTATQVTSLHQTLNFARYKKLLISLLILAIIVIAAITNMINGESSSLKYTKISSITQTDAHETQALYSPNMDYIVFNRYAGACKSHLWAKHIASGKERQLTARAGIIQGVSFTESGRGLVFSTKVHCEQSSVDELKQLNDQCWNIATLDFATALSTPQMPILRHQCQAEKLINPHSLGNHQYAFLQHKNDHFQLMHYNDLTKKLTELYSSIDEYLYHFDYEPFTKHFAVISKNTNLNHVLTLLNNSGELQSKTAIKLSEDINQNHFLLADFEPNGEYLLTVNHGALFQLNFNGHMVLVPTPTNDLQSIVADPSRNTALAITGAKDIDIAQIHLGEKPLSITKTDLTNNLSSFTSIARTAAQERRAQYQPHGEHIAFISNRNGRDQIWVWSNNEAVQLTSNLSPGIIDNYSWSPDGQAIAWANQKHLAITNLAGNTEYIDTDIALNSVLAWYNENELLVQINDLMPKGLYHFNLETQALTPYQPNHVAMTWVANNNIYYSNEKGDVYLRSLDAKDNDQKRLDKLNGKALVINSNLIYSVDSTSFQLNQYNLDGQFIQTIMPLTPQAWKITGLKNKQLLLSQFIAINQEVVLLE